MSNISQAHASKTIEYLFDIYHFTSDLAFGIQSAGLTRGGGIMKAETAIYSLAGSFVLLCMFAGGGHTRANIEWSHTQPLHVGYTLQRIPQGQPKTKRKRIWK